MVETFPGVKADYSPALTGITFSSRFLATYPPYFGEVHCNSDADGQLNLLKPKTEDEPPDPDDFESLDAFREAIALWDTEHLDTLIELFEVSELSSAIESSDTCNFFIPTFGAFKGDRTNGNFLDEPPTAGIGACRPKPKPPSFSPTATEFCPCGAMPAAQCDGTTAIHIYPDRIVFTPCYKNDLVGLILCDWVGARSPPGGDVFI